MSFEAAPSGHAPGRPVPEVQRRGDRSVGLPVKIVKVLLFLASWTVFLWWLSLWYRMPTVKGKAFKKQVSNAVGKSDFWGKYGT
jgi:hypothetical protein